MPQGIAGAEPTNSTRAAFNLERGFGRFKAAPMKKEGEAKHYQSTVVELLDDTALTTLEEMGCVIFGHRDNLALVCVPDESVDAFLDCPLIGEIQSATPCTTAANVARAFTGSEAVLNYSPSGFDGTGVVVGLSDTGFDAGHSAFAGRVRRFSYFNDEAGSSFRLDSEDEILAQGTENPGQYHATMCANLLAGSREASPYFGMAPGSDLVVTTSNLYDAGMIAGIDEVIDYARSVGKPAVVSLSIANFMGPHDGTDLPGRYMGMQAEEAVLVISAGNSGMGISSIRGNFTDEKTSLRGVLRPSSEYEPKLNGSAQVWGFDSRPFGLNLLVWDRINDVEVYRRKICDLSSTESQDIVIFTEDDPEGLGKFFLAQGGISVSSGYYKANGRFNASLSFDLTTAKKSKLPDYAVVLEVEGVPGQEVHYFADGIRTWFDFTGVAGSLHGSSEMSVNNLATTKNAICVGSVTDRGSFTLDNGYSFEVPSLYPYNAPSVFTSYALDMADGRSYPDLLAPGEGIMSAMSSYRNPTAGYCVERPDGRKDYWTAGEGTSFSTPIVAGIIAQWYQANPALSPAKMREIAISTASKDLVNADDPRTGAGKIDALAGLRRVLLENVPSGIENIRNEADILIRTEGRTVIAENLGGDTVTLEVFTPSGVLAGKSSEGRVDCPASGIYICRSISGSQSSTKRIIL